MKKEGFVVEIMVKRRDGRGGRGGEKSVLRRDVVLEGTREILLRDSKKEKMDVSEERMCLVSFDIWDAKGGFGTLLIDIMINELKK